MEIFVEEPFCLDFLQKYSAHTEPRAHECLSQWGY